MPTAGYIPSQRSVVDQMRLRVERTLLARLSFGSLYPVGRVSATEHRDREEGGGDGHKRGINLCARCTLLYMYVRTCAFYARRVHLTYALLAVPGQAANRWRIGQ